MLHKPVYLLGGGGHGKVVLDALLEAGFSVSGILDPGLNVGDIVFGVPVLGGDAYLKSLKPNDILLANGLGASPSVQIRRQTHLDATENGFSFCVLRHPSAIVGRECAFKPGAQIMAGAVLQNQIIVGDGVVINTRASIDHDCNIGAHAFIAPGAVLCGNVTVGDSAFIGAGAVVMPGIKIGTKAVIGAGAVVTKSVPDGWTVVGNPAGKIS